MPEENEEAGPGGGEPGAAAARPERVGEALRRAVERTLAATADSAAGTRQRAEGLLDEVTRRGLAARQEVARRGEAAREEVARAGESAREEVSRRGEELAELLADAISELRRTDRADVGVLSERIRDLDARLGRLEGALRRASGPERDAEHGDDAESQAQVEPEAGPRQRPEPGPGADA